MNINIDCIASGIVFDAPTAAYTTQEMESLIGVEITDLGGQLDEHHVGVFITQGFEGRKVLLTSSAARELSDILLSFADLLDAGATSSERN